MTKFMIKLLIAVALMPVGYALGIMLAAMLVFGGEGGVKQVLTSIAAKPPIKAAPVEATFAKLEAVIPNREFAQPTDVLRKIDVDNAQRTQSAAADQKKVNDVGSEQKPPAPPKNMCFLGMTRNGVKVGSGVLSEDAEMLYYQNDAPNCLHRPHVEPSWQTALFRHLYQYKGYPSDTQSRSDARRLVCDPDANLGRCMVLLSFTVDRSGHVLNREIVTVDHGRVVNREIVRHSGQSEFESEVISMIDRAEPLPPFPDNMTESTLDLIAPIYGPVKPTPPHDWGRTPGLPSLGLSLECAGTSTTTPEKNTPTIVVPWVVVDSHNVFVSQRDTTDWQVFVLPVTRVDGGTVFFAYKSGQDQTEGFISHNTAGEYDATLNLWSNDRLRAQHWDDLQCKTFYRSEFAEWLALIKVQEREPAPKNKKMIDSCGHFWSFCPGVGAGSLPKFTIPFRTLPPSPQCPKIIGDGALMCGKLAEKYDLYCCN